MKNEAKRKTTTTQTLDLVMPPLMKPWIYEALMFRALLRLEEKLIASFPPLRFQINFNLYDIIWSNIIRVITDLFFSLFPFFPFWFKNKPVKLKPLLIISLFLDHSLLITMCCDCYFSLFFLSLNLSHRYHPSISPLFHILDLTASSRSQFYIQILFYTFLIGNPVSLPCV